MWRAQCRRYGCCCRWWFFNKKRAAPHISDISSITSWHAHMHSLFFSAFYYALKTLISAMPSKRSVGENSTRKYFLSSHIFSLFLIFFHLSIFFLRKCIKKDTFIWFLIAYFGFHFPVRAGVAHKSKLSCTQHWESIVSTWLAAIKINSWR